MENLGVIFLTPMVRDDKGAAHTDVAQLATQRSSLHWLWEHQLGVGVSHSRAGQGKISKTVMPPPRCNGPGLKQLTPAYYVAL